MKVTYNWTDSQGRQQQSHVFASKGTWQLTTGQNVRTRWVEFEPVAGNESVVQTVDTSDSHTNAKGWVAAMQKVRAKFRGQPGTFAQFGDSITESRAFWSGVRYRRDNAGPELQKAFQTVSKYMQAAGWDGKGPENGNQGGRTVRWAHQNVGQWLTDLNPETAVLMFGTNDLNSVPAAEYRQKLQGIIQQCLDNGTVVILTTIPPRNKFEEKSAAYADIMRQTAKKFQLPLIDFHAEILKRRPGDWNGALDKFRDYQGYDVPTLIARDGVHPSAPKNLRGNFSKEALQKNGFALRNYLTVLMYGEVIERVYETPTAD